MDVNNSKWTKTQTSLLITLLEQNSCLYDTLNPDYINKIKRENSYQIICEILSQIKKDVTIRDVESKIRILLGQYSREKKGGVDTEEVYNPKLWCYEYLKFLDASMEGDVGTSNTLESSCGQNSSNDIRMEKVVTTKKRKLRELEEKAASALNFASSFLEQQPVGTEELFCKYLSAEIKNVKLEHILRKLRMDMLTLVSDAIKKDKEERTLVSDAIKEVKEEREFDFR